jgi:N-acyl-D-aspartate/D-glutamate deacylase
MTEVPARAVGLRGRGALREGYAADIVIFDPDTVGPAPVETRSDLPGGARRIYAGSYGVEHVLVNGESLVDRGTLLDATPGSVLRSERGTDTVFAH